MHVCKSSLLLMKSLQARNRPLALQHFKVSLPDSDLIKCFSAEFSNPGKPAIAFQLGDHEMPRDCKHAEACSTGEGDLASVEVSDNSRERAHGILERQF